MCTCSKKYSYTNKQNNRAENADILIMNEVGLDPGIDHMSAMKIIDEAKENGSKVKRKKNKLHAL